MITACLNAEAYIEQTILSVLSQKNCDLEYLIIDGGSTDQTMTIANRYKSQIDILVSEKDNGIYDAFNKGIRLATGDVVYFLNADDYFFDEYVLSRVNAQFDKYPECKAVYGKVIKVSDLLGHQLAGHELSEASLRRGANIPHQGVFAKKKVMEEYGGFDLRYRLASDLDFVTKLFLESPDQFLYFDETISFFRLTGASSSPVNQQTCRNEQAAIVKKYFGDEYAQQLLQNVNMNADYYRKWVELLLCDSSQSASSSLIDQDIFDVAIFGTVDMSAYVLADLRKNSIRVHAFLDNAVAKHGSFIGGVEVHSPEWLKKHGLELDAVIFAFEGKHDEVVQAQLSDIMSSDSIRCISWRDMINWSLK